MKRFGSLSASEIERRRKLSVEAFDDLKRREFADWYRLKCDSDYWKFGQRCSGCDFWASEQGNLGECQQGGIVSGEDVMRSMGIQWMSIPSQPGYPMREASHWCVNFKDDFDWSTLPDEYLHQIGAMKDGVLREKPRHSDPYAQEPRP